MAITQAQINAGWAEYDCPTCGKPSGHLDTVEQVETSNYVGTEECEDCIEQHDTFSFIMGLRA